MEGRILSDKKDKDAKRDRFSNHLFRIPEENKEESAFALKKIMKRIFIIFIALLVVFFGAWGVKASNPINRPDNLDDGNEVPWYESRYVAPQAADEWYLDPEIPLNYIPVPGEDELYMVVDDSGNITGYRSRAKQADGTWLWQDVNPDIPENYEKVEGLDNVYKVTNEDGSVSYYQYVRNEDDTFCFVPVDENGIPLDNNADATKITDRYVVEDGNVYAVYNDDNVLMGYRERVENEDGDGYVWAVTDKPKKDTSSTQTPSFITGNSGNNNSNENGNGYTQGTTAQPENNVITETKSDGTYVKTETLVETVTENGYTITYVTKVESTYSKDGTLLSTKKDGPYEESRVAVSSTPEANKNLIASTLEGELARVSANVEFNTDKANEVLAKLNAERVNQGLGTLTMNTNSDTYKVACIRAADMAIYDHGGTSPMYGTLDDLIERYQVSSKGASENIWKASLKTSAQIHTRFQANENSRNARMSTSYTEVAIAVVDSNNQTYIAEIYLN